MAQLQTIPPQQVAPTQAVAVVDTSTIRRYTPDSDTIIEQRIKDNIAFWKPWLKVVHESYDMRMMEPTIPGSGEFITPDVRVGFNLAKHMLSRKPSRYSIARSTEQDEATHRINSDTERFLQHNWENNDFKLRLQGRESFDRQVADWAIGTGFLDVLWYVGVDAEGFPIFVADPLDPTQTFPEFGSIEDGMLALDRVFTQTVSSIGPEAERKGWDMSDVPLTTNGKKQVTVKDHWEQRKQPDDKYAVYHVVYVEDKKVWAEFEDAPEGIPIVSIPVGGMQTAASYFTNPSEAAAHWGENILIPSQMVYKMRNMIWSMQGQDIVDKVKRTIIDQTMGRRGVISAADIGKIVHLDLNESVHELVRQSMAADFGQVQAGLDQMQQRSLFPWTMFGQTPFDLSGVALEQLNAAAITVIGPAQEAIEFAKTVISLGWLAEFKRRWSGTGTTIRVTGIFENKSRSLVLTPEDVPERPNVVVKKAIDLAADKITKANIARLLRPQGDLAPYEYIADEIMEFQDPDLFRDRIIDDAVYQDPGVVEALNLVALDEMAEAAKQEGHERKAAILRSAFERRNAAFGQPSDGQGGGGVADQARPGTNPQARAPFANNAREVVNAPNPPG